MAAYGSGAVAHSIRDRTTVMNVDVGGGTSKISVCSEGRVVDLTAVDIGARLICLDAVGVGAGELIYWCRGKEASFPFLPAQVPTEATISPSGVCSTVKAGTPTITATFDGVQGTTVLTVH